MDAGLARDPIAKADALDAPFDADVYGALGHAGQPDSISTEGAERREGP